MFSILDLGLSEPAPALCVDGHINIVGPDGREEVQRLLAEEALVRLLEPAPLVLPWHQSRPV
jgi:hypothetical protein